MITSGYCQVIYGSEEEGVAAMAALLNSWTITTDVDDKSWVIAATPSTIAVTEEGPSDD